MIKSYKIVSWRKIWIEIEILKVKVSGARVGVWENAKLRKIKKILQVTGGTKQLHGRNQKFGSAWSVGQNWEYPEITLAEPKIWFRHFRQTQILSRPAIWRLKQFSNSLIFPKTEALY